MAVAWSKPVGEFRQADELVSLLHPILLIDLKIAEIETLSFSLNLSASAFVDDNTLIILMMRYAIWNNSS
jgi:hypothetical protein